MASIVEISEKILKQIALALNTAKLYPPGHPLFEKMVDESLKILTEIPAGLSTISFYFFENTVIVEKEKIDISKFPAIQSLIKYLNRINVKSISIDYNADRKDWESFYKIFSIPIKEIKETEDVGVLLYRLGAERIRINDVEFGVISARQVEVKFDMENVIERIKKGELPLLLETYKLFETLTGIHPSDLEYLSKEEIILKVKEFKEKFEKDCKIIEVEKISLILFQIFEKLGGDLRNDVLEMMLDGELKDVAIEIIKNFPEREILKFIIFYKDKRKEIIEHLPYEKRKKLYDYLSKTKEDIKIIKSILPRLPHEEFLELFSSRVKNFPEEFDEILNSLPPEKIEALKKRELIEGEKIFTPSPKLLEIGKLAKERQLIITGEKKFEAMKKELKEGIRTDEFEGIIEPFLKDIKSEDIEKRKYSVNGIGSLLLSFLKTGKIRLAKRLIEFFKENIKEEEEPEVFFTYLEYFQRGYVIAKENNISDIIELFEVEFKELLDIKEKRKFVIRALGKTKSDFALRMLLTTLWEEESLEEIKDALTLLGEKAIKELLKLFPEIENLMIRKRIIDLVVSLPQMDLKELKELLFDKRWSVQRDILYIIGEKKLEELIPYIEEIVLTGQDIVRKEAVRALSKMKNDEAKKILLKSLEDKNEEIRKEAIKALSGFTDEETALKIKEYLRKNIEKIEESEILLEIIKGLKKIKDKEIVPLLFKILEEKNIFRKPKYPPELRKEALRYLAEFKEDKKIIEKLKDFKNDPEPEIRTFVKIFLLRIA
jgi:HEAT repeat protein